MLEEYQQKEDCPMKKKMKIMKKYGYISKKEQVKYVIKAIINKAKNVFC